MRTGEKEDVKGQLETHYVKTQFLRERVSGLAPPGTGKRQERCRANWKNPKLDVCMHAMGT